MFWQAVSPWHGAGWWGFGQHDGDGAKAKEKDHSRVVLCVGEAQRFPVTSRDGSIWHPNVHGVQIMSLHA